MCLQVSDTKAKCAEEVLPSLWMVPPAGPWPGWRSRDTGTASLFPFRSALSSPVHLQFLQLPGQPLQPRASGFLRRASWGLRSDSKTFRGVLWLFRAHLAISDLTGDHWESTEENISIISHTQSHIHSPHTHNYAHIFKLNLFSSEP